MKTFCFNCGLKIGQRKPLVGVLTQHLEGQVKRITRFKRRYTHYQHGKIAMIFLSKHIQFRLIYYRDIISGKVQSLLFILLNVCIVYGMLSSTLQKKIKLSTVHWSDFHIKGTAELRVPQPYTKTLFSASPKDRLSGDQVLK